MESFPPKGKTPCNAFLFTYFDSMFMQIKVDNSLYLTASSRWYRNNAVMTFARGFLGEKLSLTHKSDGMRVPGGHLLDT